MRITFRDYMDWKVIEPIGEVDLYNVSELKKSMFTVTDGTHKYVLVDLSKVTYMDSSGIGALVAGNKKMKAHGGEFALVNIQNDVLNILKLATLDRYFKIYETEDDII